MYEVELVDVDRTDARSVDDSLPMNKMAGTSHVDIRNVEKSYSVHVMINTDQTITDMMDADHEKAMNEMETTMIIEKDINNNNNKANYNGEEIGNAAKSDEEKNGHVAECNEEFI